MKPILMRAMMITALALASSSAAADSLFAVTDVRVVEAASRPAALDACQADGLSVGIDWGKGSTGGTVHLCQQRTRVDQLNDGTSVLQRVAVVSGSSCPLGTKLLVAPRANVAVCAGFVPFSAGLADAGNYIEDLAATSERNYNNDRPGWTTLPYSLHTSVTAPTPANRGVYVSVREPVRAVTELRVFANLTTDEVASACTGLGAAWRLASDNAGFLDQPTGEGKTVLCAKRKRDVTPLGPGVGCGDASVVQLIDVTLVDASASCPTGFASSSYALSSSTALCAKWAPLSNGNTNYIADLNVHRVITALGEGTDPQAAEFVPGSFTLVANRNLNTAAAPAYLFVRKFQATLAAPTPAPLAKPPITAKLDASGASLSFKILQIADLHYTGDPTFPCRDAPASLAANCTEATMTQWVNDLLDAEKPDFVAFTGDNVETFTAERRELAMQAVVGGVEARGIPYGLVFGNHDDENGFSREDVVRIASSKPHSYTQRGPADVDGVGNYELGVQAPVDGPWGARGADVFRMYFLDSHGYPDRAKYPLVSATYDWVKPSQIEYYRQLSEAHAARRNRVPAVMFFHIPLVEYAANAPTKTNGEQYESVASSDVSTNLFSTLVDLREVKATFVGHDHVNDYCYRRQGIQLCYGGGVGFGRAYGSRTFARRARAIEWTVNSKGERSIRSWKRLFGELSAKWLEETLYSESAPAA